MKIRKGDTVKVIAGGNSKKNKDNGAIGEVLKVNAKDNTVVVAGVNMITKHVKPNQSNPEGSIKTYEGAIDASNVAFYDKKAKKTRKIKYMFTENGEKIRAYKDEEGNLVPLDKKVKKATKKATKVAKEEVAEAPKAKKTRKTTKKVAEEEAK